MKEEEFALLPLPAQEYLNHLSYLNLSVLTIREYGSDLRLFFNYLAKTRKLCDFTDGVQPDLSELFDMERIRTIRLNETVAFLAYCRTERGCSPKTRARKVTSLKRFFSYLVQQQGLERNPCEGLQPPKAPKTLPKFLSLEEAQRLLEAVGGDFKARDRAMLMLFLNCGIRLSELTGLNLRDIHRDAEGAPYIRVHGKGDKERDVYLNAGAFQALEEYAKVRPQDRLKAADRDALFISKNYTRISNRGTEYVLEQCLLRSGLAGLGYTVHKLRHTAATLMYQNDVDVLELQQILGHENLSTTQIYTHVVNRQLKAAVDANPLGRAQ
ncbi:MAG: tyrosine recombinase XerC [Oscillospiraceae bacterium]|jgi:site-specific recombinase XerD|nr:tyrosine recombinase XerC [Oscillospiraceae bacterium]